MYSGKHFKNIRNNRSYNQSEVSDDIISQSAYSKFETGKRDVDASVYLQLLQRLNIPAEEFDYVRNNYNYGLKQTFIHTLFSMNYNHMENLHTLKHQITDFLEEQFDEDIKEIYLICEAFIQLHDTKDMEVAKNIVEPIWRRMSKYEQWYLNDIRVINAILFLFPVDIAIKFAKTVIVRLDTYKDFRDAERLKSAFKINLSLLLIKNKEYAKAYTIIVDSFQCAQKKMNYSILALHFSREAICRANMQLGGSTDLLEKARQLLLLYDDQDYWERIQQEFNHYTSAEINSTDI